jgi:hypothetical protein
MRRFTVALASATVALALVSAAIGGAGKNPGYQGPGESVQGQVEQGVAGEQFSSGTLPFSGLELTVFVVGGAALILMGTGFYRLSRRRQ